MKLLTCQASCENGGTGATRSKIQKKKSWGKSLLISFKQAAYTQHVEVKKKKKKKGNACQVNAQLTPEWKQETIL